MIKNCILIMLAFTVAFTLSNCGSVDPRIGGYSLSQLPNVSSILPGRGRVALINGRAVAPANAPAAVKRAVAAGNALQGKSYKMGGGHGRWNDYGYDCSGTVSYVLRNAGLLNGSMSSSGFKSYGRWGKGRWITIYARNGHVFMTVGGLRLDARGSDHGYHGGPRWLAEPRSPRGFSVRHPAGL